jgi:ribosomal protein L40E
MKGPLQAIRRRRSERRPETDTAQAATQAPTEAQPAVDPASVAMAPAVSEATSTGEQPTAAQPATDVPAGQEPIPERPSFRKRGRLRRRLRYLRRVRELGFRDLGGLVFDQHKFAHVDDELVRGKLMALAAVDSELRALEHALGDRRPLTELREPGISVCPRCGALHGSDARYCPSCGVPVHGPRAIAEVGEAVSLSVGQIGSVAAPTEPPASAQPPGQLTLQSEPPAAVQPEPEPEPQPEPEPEPEAPPQNDQPTEVVRPVDDDAADGIHGAVAQPSGERRES